MKKTLLFLFASALCCLATGREVQAWGGYHAGYTSHSPGGGFTHSSSSAAYGPYGEHSSSRSTSYNPSTGFSHTGSGQTSGYGGESSYHYSSGGGGSGSYHGGYQSQTGAYGSYGGAYRRW